MSVQNHAAIQSLPILASALGRKYGIQVEYGGSEAYTNGNKIHLPALPETLDNDTMMTVNGYIDHESAHCRLSNFSILEKERLSHTEKFIHNALEDVYVEREFSKLYQGCAGHFAWLVKNILIENATCGIEPTSNVLNWILLYVRSLDHKQIIQPVLDKVEPKLDQDFPQLRDNLKPILDKVRYSRSTAENLVITREVIKVLETYLPVDNKPTNTSQTKGKGGQTDSGDKDDRTLLDSLEELAKSDIDQLIKFDDRIKTNITIGVHSKKNKSTLISTATEVPPLPYWKYFTEAELSQSRTLSARLKQRLQLMLQGQTRSMRIPTRSGSLNMRKLAHIKIGDIKIFNKLTQGESTSAAIEILVDTSFSTTPFLSDLLLISATLMEALNIKGVETALTTFPMRAKANCEGICVLFNYGDKFSANRMPKIPARGSTPLAQCLRSVLLRILQRPEKNKHIFLLTDAGQCDDNTLAKHSIEAVAKAGVHLHTIAIRSQEIKRLIPDAIVINNVVQDLPKALFEEVMRSLKSNK